MLRASSATVSPCVSGAPISFLGLMRHFAQHEEWDTRCLIRMKGKEIKHFNDVSPSKFYFEYLMPGNQDVESSFVALPLTEEQMETMDLTALPNPLEVRVSLSVKPGAKGPEYNFQSSALLGF